jgi:hypothetical protein
VRKITIDAIQKAVAENFAMRVSELKQKNNSRAVVVPRQIAMYLAKNLTEASLKLAVNSKSWRDELRRSSAAREAPHQSKVAAGDAFCGFLIFVQIIERGSALFAHLSTRI